MVGLSIVPVTAAVPPVVYRQNPVIIAIQPFNDTCERTVILCTRDDRVAVLVEHLEHAHGERVRGFLPQAGELLEIEVAVTVCVVFCMMSVPHLVDFRLCQFAVTVLVDGIEHVHRKQLQVAHCVMAATVAGIRVNRTGKQGHGNADDDQCSGSGSGSGFHQWTHLVVVDVTE